jgi:HPt (histidine-containing phosphotransfer) domain-containing protein
MEELIVRFKDEAKDRLETIETLLNGISDAPDAADRCNAIREEAHKIKGAAGVLGFPEMKERAAELEVVAAARCEDADDNSALAFESLMPRVAALREALP